MAWDFFFLAMAQIHRVMAELVPEWRIQEGVKNRGGPPPRVEEGDRTLSSQEYQGLGQVPQEEKKKCCEEFLS